MDILFNSLFEYLSLVKTYSIFNRAVLKYDGSHIVLGSTGSSFEDFASNFTGKYKAVDLFMLLYDRTYSTVITINI